MTSHIAYRLLTLSGEEDTLITSAPPGTLLSTSNLSEYWATRVRAMDPDASVFWLRAANAPADAWYVLARDGGDPIGKPMPEDMIEAARGATMLVPSGWAYDGSEGFTSWDDDLPLETYELRNRVAGRRVTMSFEHMGGEFHPTEHPVEWLAPMTLEVEDERISFTPASGLPVRSVENSCRFYDRHGLLVIRGAGNEYGWELVLAVH